MVDLEKQIEWLQHELQERDEIIDGYREYNLVLDDKLDKLRKFNAVLIEQKRIFLNIIKKLEEQVEELIEGR